MPDRKKLILIFFAVFFFHLLFGLGQSNWGDYDEKQSYLTGLKFYTTGDWPFFGPDAAGSESSYYSQIPGALEGLVIGLPFYLLPIPEAPFILVNLLSAAGVLFLAFYIRKRLPLLSFTWLCAWIAAVPWSAYYPTHISNMSYLFLPGVLFFVALLESLPALSVKWLSPSSCGFLMGFSLFWVMQFHLSYLFLWPLALLALASQWKKGRLASFLPAFLIGSFLPLCFVLPTYLQYGLGRANSHSGFFAGLNLDNMAAFFTLLARFLSLACFELPTFIGAHTNERVAFLTNHPLLLLPGAVLWVGGIAQALFLLLAWFRRDDSLAGWREMKRLTAWVFLFVYASFWLTIKPPLSHIYLVLFPLVMIYACYVWASFGEYPRLRIAAKVFVVLAVLFQAGYALAVAPKNSLYTERDLVARALKEKNYHLLGERSPGSLY